MSKVRVEIAQGGLAITTPYNPDFVIDLKRGIPPSARKWDKPHWIVDPKFGEVIRTLIALHYNENVTIPVISDDQQLEIQVFPVEYIGACKERSGGLSGSSAMGFANGSWSVVFPESALRAFFEKTGGSDYDSYYDMLCIKPSANDDEIKKAFRRLALQWHPDICKEPGAEAFFKQLNEANQILSDPTTRKRYNAWLKFERDAGRANPHRVVHDDYGYRSPLRCGMIVVEGVYRVGRFIVTKILNWNDIINASGQTMTSYWSVDQERVVIEWIDQ
jgi:hypothetical protein